MHITEYFHHVETLISKHPAITVTEISYEQRTRHLGFIKGHLIFKDTSELYFKEFVDGEKEIRKYKYAYHYQKENKIIFRYLEEILKEISLLLD